MDISSLKTKNLKLKTVIHLSTDHAGFALKESLKPWLVEQGHEVIDHGAVELEKEDDYPDFVKLSAQAVSENPHDRAIIFGGSGQGEAITANRFKNVRAVVYYGEPSEKQVDSDGQELDMITSARLHNDANVLSLGARFISEEQAKQAVQRFLGTDFEEEERHVRRINKIDA